MKKAITLLLALTMALMPAAALADGEDVKIYLDGQLLTLTDADGNAVTPIIIDGTTYLPVRAISGALGLDVEWDEDTRSISLTGNSRQIIAADATIFANLGRYVGNAYELLGRSAFLNPLKELVGDDYGVLSSTLATTYADGDESMITLHCSDQSVIDVYSDGRIDVALLSPGDKDFGGEDVIKYFSTSAPDAVDSPGLVDFITQNAAKSGYTAIIFMNGSSAPDSVSGTYYDTAGFGSFTFTENENEAFGFKGSIKDGPNGSCSSSGTIFLTNGSTVCTENNAPAILFAFSGDSLTVIGLNSITKALTATYKK